MYYVKPAGENIRDLTGQFIPYDRTYNEGKCVFLDDNNLCEIYLVRPHTARIMECWTPNPLEYDHMKGWRESNVLTEIYTDWEDVDE